MFLHPHHIKLFDYCRENGRGLLTRTELKFIDDINNKRARFSKRHAELTKPQQRFADKIIAKLVDKTRGNYALWKSPDQPT